MIISPGGEAVGPTFSGEHSAEFVHARLYGNTNMCANLDCRRLRSVDSPFCGQNSCAWEGIQALAKDQKARTR